MPTRDAQQQPRARRHITYFPTFRNRHVEREYATQLGPGQIRSDFRTAVIGVVMQSVVAAKGVHKFDLPAAYALVAALFCFLPICTIIFNRQDYLGMRERILTVWLVAVWYYGAKCADTANDMSPSNVLLLVLRSQTLQLFWANLSLRLPFRLHALVHAVVVMATFVSNQSYCRWALGQPPAPWFRKFVSTMRRIARVGPLPSRSLAASDVGMCTVMAGFAQMLLGYTLPTYITLLIELKSRHTFFCQRVRRQAIRRLPQGTDPDLVPQLRPWTPGLLLSWHLLWLGALAAVACWRLAEAAAVHFPEA